MRFAISTRHDGEKAVPNEFMDNITSGAAGATVVSFVLWLKSRIERQDRKEEIRSIVRETMNPELLEERHSEVTKRLDRLTIIVERRMTDRRSEED